MSLSKFSELGGPSDDVCAWTHLITNFPVQWKLPVRCLDSPFSVLDKPDPLSQCVSHVPDCVGQECLQLDIQRSFFLQRALDKHLLKTHNHRPSIGQYIGPDNRCSVCHVTFALRYLAVAHASRVKPRSGANRSCHQVILSGSIEKVSEDTLKRLEARRLRTVARKGGKYHIPAPCGSLSFPVNLHPMMVTAHQSRQGVCVGHQCYVFPLWPSRDLPTLAPDADSPVHKHLRMFPPASCLRRLLVPPLSSVQGSFKRRRWSEFAIVPHVVP